ncbi:uncharacterized protein LOC122084773 [Macadamia integrifolia]|uniref:uncharacterized protein LOC122084773 n=1 Tax=Macadamia integrifolia TaxID=60698 RepID=UPI001C4F2508|nr:uncharacterized protein LOC122084773 [Macadamia integrifolia]
MDDEEEELVYEVKREKQTIKTIISALQVVKLFEDGCQGNLASILDVDAKFTPLEELEVVKEFPDVFPDDLIQLLPNRELEFTIDLTLGAAPVFKAPDLQNIQKYDCDGVAYEYFLRMMDHLAWGDPSLYGADFILQPWAYEHLDFLNTPLLEGDDDILPLTWKWGAGGTICGPLPLTTTRRDVLDQLTVVNWTPFQMVNFPSEAHRDQARRLTGLRVLFQGPNGSTWYLGERVTRQWFDSDAPLVPHHPAPSMHNPSILSEENFQVALIGVTRDNFMDPM